MVMRAKDGEHGFTLSPEEEAELLLSIAEAERGETSPADEVLERIWAAEVERRHAELENGSVSAIPGPEALAKLKADFKVRRR